MVGVAEVVVVPTMEHEAPEIRKALRGFVPELEFVANEGHCGHRLAAKVVHDVLWNDHLRRESHRRGARLSVRPEKVARVSGASRLPPYTLCGLDEFVVREEREELDRVEEVGLAARVWARDACKRAELGVKP